MRAERWLPVPGWPEYRVSTYGRVWSVARQVRRRDGRLVRVPGRMLRPWESGTGYLMVGLHRAGEVRTVYVHRLVALAFLPAPEQGEEVVRHVNGDQYDCGVGNLAWGTYADNTRDQVRHEREHGPAAARAYRNRERWLQRRAAA